MSIYSMAASTPATRTSEKAFEAFLLCHREELHSSTMQVQDSDGKIFSITSVQKPEDLDGIPKNIPLDYRIRSNQELRLACFTGKTKIHHLIDFVVVERVGFG
jgi:hypothetical protein